MTAQTLQHEKASLQALMESYKAEVETLRTMGTMSVAGCCLFFVLLSVVAVVLSLAW